MKQELTAILTLILLPFTASWAGPRDGGGGHVVSCSGKPVVTLDYYNAVIKKKPGSSIINPENEDVLAILVDRLNAASKALGSEYTVNRHSFGDWLERTVNDFGPLAHWPNADLPLIKDHSLIYTLPSNCKLIQAAAQEINGDTIFLYQNKTVTKNLKAGQNKLLEIHEAIYSYVRQELGDNSRPVRSLLERLLLEELSDQNRNQALKDFVSEISLASKKWICQAQSWPSYNRYIDLDRRPSIKTSFGKTAEKAFENLPNSDGFGILCNRVEQLDATYRTPGLGICVEKPTINNCKPNYAP